MLIALCLDNKVHNGILRNKGALHCTVFIPGFGVLDISYIPNQYKAGFIVSALLWRLHDSEPA